MTDPEYVDYQPFPVDSIATDDILVTETVDLGMGPMRMAAPAPAADDRQPINEGGLLVVDGPAIGNIDIPDGYDGYRIIDANGDVVRLIAVPEGHNLGDMHHTIDELYEHRRALTAVLATIGAVNGDAWRSKLHNPEDGPMFDGSFIVGVELPSGPISYHYKLAYWDKFAAVPELEHAPKWDGAGPADTIARLDDFTCHLKLAIDEGRAVQEEAREAADAVVGAAEAQTVNHLLDGSCCTAVVAAEEEEDVRP